LTHPVTFPHLHDIRKFYTAQQLKITPREYATCHTPGSYPDNYGTLKQKRSTIHSKQVTTVSVSLRQLLACR